MHTDLALRLTQIDFSLEVKLRRCYAHGPKGFSQTMITRLVNV